MTTAKQTQEIVTLGWPKNWFEFCSIFQHDVIPRVPEGMDWWLLPGGDGQWVTLARDENGCSLGGYDLPIGWDSAEQPIGPDTVIPLVLRFCPGDGFLGMTRSCARLDVWCERMAEGRRLGAKPWLEEAEK